MSTEEDKLKADSIGLFNIGDDEGSRTYKVKLSTADAKEFSLFEGEVVVAEGSNDSNSRFNAARIHKPLIQKNQATNWTVLQKSIES